MNLPMPGSELLALLGFATAMAFTPGPNTTLSAALAANHGLRRALPFVAGVPVGWGALLQLVNIKAWMAALLISAGWVSLAPDLWARIAFVLPLLMIYGLLSNLAYALLGSVLRGWLAQGARLLWFNRLLALVLLATALWMARL